MHNPQQKSQKCFQGIFHFLKIHTCSSIYIIGTTALSLLLHYSCSIASLKHLTDKNLRVIYKKDVQRTSVFICFAN